MPPQTRPWSWPAALTPFRLALSFLTIVPVRFRDGEATGAAIAASRWAYPAVGAAVGAALALVSAALARSGAPPGVAAFVVLLAWVVITGGLHLDGLADTADGLFLWGDAERRLAVMRDPRVGSFGVAAVVLVLLGKYAALSGLPAATRPGALLLAAAAGRTLVLVSAGLAPYARREGTGRVLADATTPRDATASALVTLLLGALAAGPSGLLAAAAAATLALAFTRLARRRLGGVTGDTLGALVETSECLILTLLSLDTPPNP